ncbi:uncharacterized protein LACBIDRAFT_306525 [Laccaria bicolor S238N-H82]|uniref:Predicted protein n=1 Tax=Laccaria bicolor (strain S238N-H82 / ATCC MYA-4686) TaxID=486041 RepID=B0DN85_LACBS|nr:uncharacterized protein LACBIDRAFT_306525 [Laccaria bicolor S238N-H82]EDR03830.1 predicted protein [Laccaria bicolor S238N-H82]|eukprot:XP_001885398.1 predicted protein [Laccaria bicolor S238N-H82]
MSFQLHKLSFALVNSIMILLPAWKACLVELSCAVRIMPRNVQTCWNLTYDMLQFSLKYKDAIKMVTTDLANSLWKYELNNNEWLIVKELVILKDGTEFFSQGSPNLANLIPAMDHIDKDFTMKTQANSKTHPAIQHTLTLAKKTLNWYYSLTDESEVYQIVMAISVLHPQHKLEYFK